METTDRNNPDLNETKDNGQQKAYLVLSEEERAKGFIRPVRHNYVHIGGAEKGELEILPKEEVEKYKKEGWVAFLRYSGEDSLVGRYLNAIELDNYQKKGIIGCGTTTSMSTGIAETYARDPKFYGATYCVCCGKHFSVDQFVWEGTNEKVGS